MQIIILFDTVGTLSIVDAKGEYAIITGSFQIVRNEVLEPLAYMSRGPVEECADVALIPAATVESVVTVERKAILAGLQVFKTEGDL